MKNDNNNAMIIHLSAFAGYLFPFGSIVAPLILWQLQRDKSDFLNDHGKEATNFNLSFLLYFTIIGILGFAFFFKALFNIASIDETNISLEAPIFDSTLFLLTLAGVLFLAVVKIVLIILATIKANEGKTYEYPLTIRFIK
ncbi:MAG: hypothetical protein CR961_00230 [Polaribacter sp.]|nr:MAG: hypothetical protein CR961_00230 [Polaribacter sp.]